MNAENNREFRDYISRKQERGVVLRAIIPLGMRGRQGNVEDVRQPRGR